MRLGAVPIMCSYTKEQYFKHPFYNASTPIRSPRAVTRYYFPSDTTAVMATASPRHRHIESETFRLIIFYTRLDELRKTKRLSLMDFFRKESHRHPVNALRYSYKRIEL